MRVRWVINSLRYCGVFEGVEGIYHHGQFFGTLYAEALFDSTRMGAVWDATRVQRDGRTLDAFAAAEIAVDIVEHLVAVNVAVIVGYRYRERVIVQLARDKGADDEVRPLEVLVNGRRLVNTPGDWLEVGNIENPGVLAAVPANGVDGVEIVPIAGNDGTNFDAHLELTTLGMRDQFFGSADVALAEGRML